MISKKAKNPAAVVAVAIGVCLISWLSMSGQTIFHKHLTIIFGTTTVVLIGALLGSVLNRDREEGPLSRT
jgi:formate/nitrite transporter FocA (FNT family)